MNLFTDHTFDTVENVKLADDVKRGSGFTKLVTIMDNNNIKYTPTASRCESIVGAVDFFVRTTSGNRIVVDKDNNFIFTQELAHPPMQMTFNDYVLICARDLMLRLYSNEEPLKLKGLNKSYIALSSIPTPYGVYYDKERDLNVAIIQMCVDAVELAGVLENHHYESVEKTEVIKYLEDRVPEVRWTMTKE